MNQNNQCPNCEAPISGQYCANCGQIQKDIRRFFLALVNEALDDIFSLNSRAWKTVVAILFRPGFLTNEYLKGRRVSYVQPIRLYFITSISFFIMLTAVNFFSPPSEIEIDGGGDVVENVGESDAAEVEESQNDPDQVDQVSDVKESLSDQPDSKLEQILDDEVKQQLQENLNDQEREELERAFAEIDKQFDNEDAQIEVPLLADDTEDYLRELLRNQVKKTVALGREDRREIIAAFLEVAPPIIFCLLPLFALLLKILYVFKGIYYTEHLIYAIHNHCFIFLILLLYSIGEIVFRSVSWVEGIISFAIFVWIPIYLWRSLKSVYKQGRFMTTIKFIGLGISYSTLLGIASLTVLLIGIFTI